MTPMRSVVEMTSTTATVDDASGGPVPGPHWYYAAPRVVAKFFPLRDAYRFAGCEHATDRLVDVAPGGLTCKA